MMMLVLTVFLVAGVVNGLDIKGKGKLLFHHDMPDDMAFDVCARSGKRRPEFVRLINNKYNTSFTAGLNGGGMEQMYRGGNIGFGIYPTDDPSISIIRAWNVEYGKAAKLTMNVTSGAIVNQEVFSDYATVMCFNDVDANNHHLVKREIDWDTIIPALDTIIPALMRVCRHYLDLSIFGSYCGNKIVPTCTRAATQLEIMIPMIQGDGLFWFPVCLTALVITCDLVGELDPISLPVCDAILRFLQNPIDETFLPDFHIA